MQSMLCMGIKNTNPLIKNLSRLLGKNLRSFVWVSTVKSLDRNMLHAKIAAIDHKDATKA